MSDPTLSLMALCKESVDILRPSFHFLFILEQARTETGNSTPDFLEQLSADFCLGPHGLSPVIEYLFQLYSSIISTYQRRLMFAEDVRKCISMINTIARPLEVLLVEFRASIFRGIYDPKGFADLHNVIKEHRDSLKVCHSISFQKLHLTLVSRLSPRLIVLMF